MAKKSSFLKNLLTTASILAVAVGATDALAAEARKVVTGTATQAGANLDQNVNAANVAVTAGSALTFVNGSTYQASGGINLAGILVKSNGANPNLIVTDNKAFTIGSITQQSGFTGLLNIQTTAGQAVNITLSGTASAVSTYVNPANKTNDWAFTSVANDYSGLGSILFQNVGDSVILTSNGATLNATIDASVAGNGTFEVNATNVTFNGAIGGTNALGTLKIDAAKNATINKNAKINVITLDAGAILEVAGGTTITTNTVDSILGTEAGTLKFTGNTTAAIDKVGFNKKVNIVQIGAGVVSFSTTTDYTAGTTYLSDAASEVQFTKAAAMNLNTDFTTEVNGSGKITLSNNHRTFAGLVGTIDKRIGEIQVTTNNTLTFNKADTKLYANKITTVTNSAGEILFNANNIEIYADIGSDLKRFNTIFLDAPALAPITVKLTEGKSIFLDSTGGLNLSTVGNNNNILELYNNTTVDGEVYTGTNANGVISVKGDTTITGGIIQNTNAGESIDRVIFNTANSLTLGKNTLETKNGINFIADGSLISTENNDFTLNANTNIVVTSNAAGMGSVIINSAALNKTLTFQQIGDVTKADTSLKLLEATGGANVVLSGSASIKKVNFGDADSTLTFSTANGQYLINEFAHASGKGTIKVSQNSTLLASSVVSTDTTSLKNIIMNPGTTLTVQDGVNLYTNATPEGGFRNSNTGDGILVFEGTSIVSGVVGSNNPLGAINITGNGKSVTFLNDVNSNAAITISKNATMILQGSVAATEIKGDAAGNGTVIFKNTNILAATSAVSANIGTTARVDTVELAGKDITFSQANFVTSNLKFTNDTDDSMTATFAAIGANKFTDIIISSTQDRKHNIVFAANDQTFNRTVGSDGNAMGNLTMSGDNNFIFNGAFFGSVQTTTKQTGTVVLNGNNSKVYNLGSADLELKVVTLSNSLSVQGGVWAQAMSIDAGKTIGFSGVVSSSGTGLSLGNNSIANFTGPNVVINSLINGSVLGNGILNFNDNVTITENIGGNLSVSSINFIGASKDQIATVSADLSANQINIGAQTFALADDVKLNGATSIAEGAYVNLGVKTLTMQNGNITIANNANVVVDLDNNNNFGKVMIGGANAANLNFTGKSINVIINDKGARSADTNSYTLLNFAANGTYTNVPEINIINKNRFTKWTVNGNSLNRVDNTQEAINSIFKNESAELLANSALYGNANTTGDAAAYTNELSQMTDDSQIIESVKHLTQQNAVHASNIVSQLTDTNNVSINNRIAAVGTSGIGAGEVRKFGAWITPMYGTSMQKELRGNSGYRMQSTGGTIGLDTEANSELTVGIAGSYVKSDVKYKNVKSGDKTKLDTYMLSIYGVQQLTDSWFMQGYATFASSKIKNSEKRIGLNQTQTATGSYDTTSYSAELLAGYNFKMDQAILTPMFGASYININDSGYKETGTTNQNLTISKKTSSKVAAIAGLRAQMSSNMNGIEIAPEIHGFVKHNFHTKNAKITASHSGLPGQLTTKNSNALKTTYNVGFGVNAVSGMYEYGAGYDLTLAKKFIGHQGSLKVRVNF